MATDLTEEAKAGFAAPQGKSPNIWSSATWFGFVAGQAIAKAGETQAPTRAHMSRGYSVRLLTDDALWIVTFQGAELVPCARREA